MSLPSIFLSHSHADKDFARRLGRALQAHGVKVWIDEAEIAIGESLIRKLSQGIDDADYVAAILSPDSVASRWVQKELELATTLEIEGKQPKVLPILYRDCKIPVFLRENLYADFRDTSNFDNVLRRLLDSIRPHEFEQRLIETIRMGTRAEFAAYQALPEVHSDELDRYFTRKGSARKRIIHLLEKHARKGWVISDAGNPSTFELYRVTILDIRDEWAVVETEEYWYLRWHDATGRRHPPIYNKRNKQKYVLSKQDDDTWLIDSNYYPGRAHQRVTKIFSGIWQKVSWWR